MLIVRGHEDHERHALAADRLDHLEAVHLRHLHVEEHQVRRVIHDRGDRFLAVAALRRRSRYPARCDSRPASRSRASGSSSTIRVLIFFISVCPSVVGGGGLSRSQLAPDRGRCRERVLLRPAADRSVRVRSGSLPRRPPRHGDDHRYALFEAMELETEVGAELCWRRARVVDTPMPFCSAVSAVSDRPSAIVADLDPELVVLAPRADVDVARPGLLRRRRA